MVEGKINRIHGWAAMKPGIEVEQWSYTPQPLGPHDVEIKIQYSGVCGTDLHNIKDEGEGIIYPAIVGHEIVGQVITKGEKVTHLKEGDYVGVGAQLYGCLENDCNPCSRGLDQHCPRHVYTFNDRYPDGQPSQGGYAEAVRANANYAIKIPEALHDKLEYVPPLMCAGVSTAASMFARNIGQGHRVGVVGIGGLGHLAIQYAAAMGAEVYAFSHSPSKREQCLELGATHFIDTSRKEQTDAIKKTLDYLFVTSSSASNQYNQYLTWVDFGGQVVLLTDAAGKMTFSASEFLHSKVAITGSLIGGVKMLQKTLEFSAQHNILPIIQKYPMDHINDALQHVDRGSVRYRAVLVIPQ